ncbi:hypothetical protein HYR69_08610 [Candidatus Sumerlaeota bacterium]|nr:hypothetical protein [Candidatus Sumerlaeota bacterium]
MPEKTRTEFWERKGVSGAVKKPVPNRGMGILFMIFPGITLIFRRGGCATKIF